MLKIPLGILLGIPHRVYLSRNFTGNFYRNSTSTDIQKLAIRNYARNTYKNTISNSTRLFERDVWVKFTVLRNLENFVCRKAYGKGFQMTQNKYP